MVGVEVRSSPLLHKRGLESVPDQEMVDFTVPNEHSELMGDGSLEGSTSSLSFDLPPPQFVLVWRHSNIERMLLEEHSTLGLPAGFFSEPEASLQRPLS